MLTASDFEPHLDNESLSHTGEILNLKSAMEDYEKEYLLKVLKRCDNDKKEAAQLLGVELRTLYRKLKKYKIQCD